MLLGMLILQEQALSQGRGRSGGRSDSESSTNRPDQRAPVSASEAGLSGIPFRIVFESLRETDGRENWEICIVNVDGSNLRRLTTHKVASSSIPMPRLTVAGSVSWPMRERIGSV